MLAETVPGAAGATRIEREGYDREKVVDGAVRGARILGEISKAIIVTQNSLIDEGKRKGTGDSPDLALRAWEYIAPTNYLYRTQYGHWRDDSDFWQTSL